MLSVFYTKFIEMLRKLRRPKYLLSVVGILHIIIFLYQGSKTSKRQIIKHGILNNNIDRNNNDYGYDQKIDKSNSLPVKKSNLSYDNANVSTLDASALYNLTPGELMKTPVIRFFQGWKNPCFIVNNPPQDDRGVWISHNSVVKCWPYLQMIGVEKSATTDLFTRLSMHQHFLPMRKADGHLVKEAQFFNGILGRDRHNDSMQGYLGLMDNGTHIINKQCPQAFKQRLHQHSGESCPYIIADFSARTINPNPKWQSHVGNEGSSYPKILASDKIKHIYPQSKIIIMLRNPVTRLFSDYRFYPQAIVNYGGNMSAADFHQRVTEAIQVWKHCIETLRLHEDVCAYSDHKWPGPDGQKLGGFWGHHSALRLMISIYSIYVNDWINRFPRDNILVIKTEDYSKEPLKYLEERVLPFLDFEPFTPEARQTLAEMEDNDHYVNSNKKLDFQMWDSTRKILENFYEPYNKQLADMLHDDRFLWKDV